MSEYTTQQILDLIEAKGARQLLELRGAELSCIDLSRWTIRMEWSELREANPQATPSWWSGLTQGIHLPDAYLEGAVLGYADLKGTNMPCFNLQLVNPVTEWSFETVISTDWQCHEQYGRIMVTGVYRFLNPLSGVFVSSHR